MAKINCPKCGKPMNTGTGVCMSCFTRVLPSGRIADEEKNSNFKSTTKSKTEQPDLTAQLITAAIFIFLIGGGYFLLSDSPEDKEAEAQANAAEAAENRRKGFHCLSSWDGSHPEVKRKVQALLHDADSFEHVETRITPVNENGSHTLIMDYRAKNGFGAMRLSSAMATVRQSNCSATLISAN